MNPVQQLMRGRDLLLGYADKLCEREGTESIMGRWCDEASAFLTILFHFVHTKCSCSVRPGSNPRCESHKQCCPLCGQKGTDR